MKNVCVCGMVCGKTVKVTDRIWAYSGKSCHLARLLVKRLKFRTLRKSYPHPMADSADTGRIGTTDIRFNSAAERSGSEL